MTDWQGFVETWLARAAGGPPAGALATGADAAFTLRSGEDVVWIHLREGGLDHALDDGFERRVDFGLSAPAAVWRRLWAPVPPPRHQGLFALLSKVPEFRDRGLARGARPARARGRAAARRWAAPRRRARPSRRWPTWAP